MFFMLYIKGKVFVNEVDERENMSEKIKRQGTMFIFSGPSGCGKSSVIKGILKDMDNIAMSVSVTTREKREGEIDGKDYYFIDETKFKEMVRNKDLYEYVDSDFGPKYGTPKEAVNKMLVAGEDVILDLDYPGVKQLRTLVGDRVKAISLVPPSLKLLEERLVNRGTDSAETIAKRMSQAEKRVKECEFYDYVIVNDRLEDAITQAKAIIMAARNERLNMYGLGDFVESVIKEA
jgi:guanylate kinase